MPPHTEQNSNILTKSVFCQILRSAGSITCESYQSPKPVKENIVSFVSLPFYAFCLLLLLAYYLVPKKGQIAVLLAFNIFFILASSGWLALFMLITMVTTYYAGRVMNANGRRCREQIAAMEEPTRKERAKVKAGWTRRNRQVLIAALIANFGIWAVIKYTDFVVLNLNKIGSHFGFATVPYANFLMPLGISFYTFTAMGYLIDVYREKYEADEDFLHVAVFITLFTHLIEGPFSRFDTLGKTLFEPHTFSYERLCLGGRRVLWGLCKKIIIADQLAIAVNYYYKNVNLYTGLYSVAAILLYAMQLYADFSGYMDIACGISLMLGIRLDENFRRPFLAVSVEDFWRRWHITLGTWFRDYVFYPVAFSHTAQKIGHNSRRKFGPRMGKLVPSYLALIFVWTITGLWHGAAWQYVFWGLANLFIIVFSMQAQPLYDKAKAILHADRHPVLWRAFQIARTFCIVGFLRVMSRTRGLRECLQLYQRVFSGWKNLGSWLHAGLWTYFPKMQSISIFTAAFFSLLLIGVDILEETGKWETVKEKTPGILRMTVYAGLFIVLLICAGETAGTATGFMYEIY